jgi:hypothetical protein
LSAPGPSALIGCERHRLDHGLGAWWLRARRAWPGVIVVGEWPGTEVPSQTVTPPCH